MKPYILFDLDGTLTDPAVGITDAVTYAFEKLGHTPPPYEERLRFIGPPLDESYAVYGFSTEEIPRGITLFREYYAQQGILDNEVYPGIPQLLATLKEKGATLYVATSKPTFFANQVLDRFALSQYFSGVIGSALEHAGVHKKDIITQLLQTYPLPAQDAVMVGDRQHDIVGAKAHGMLSVGLLLGYGGRQELQDAGADYIAQDVLALQEILLSL